MAKPLNKGQQLAADGFFEFLLTDEKEMIISGAGGVGKTYLMGYLIDEIMPRYHETCRLLGIPIDFDEVVMCATTNKAAEVLTVSTGRPTSTVHSFMNLTVKDDYSTGRSFIKKTAAWTVHQRKIIFIDECSMIDSDLMAMLMEGTYKCKIIYVGDHSQLAPVMEALSPVYKKNLRMYVLDEPMRNADQPALKDVCQQIRETVASGIFNPIQVVPGVVDWFDDAMMEQEVHNHFYDPDNNHRILAYTNNRVLEFNDHIRGIRNLPDTFTKGEHLINNSAIRLGKSMISVEQEVTIRHMNDITSLVDMGNGVELEVRHCDLENSIGEMFYGVPIPVDRDHYTALMKWYGKQKDWQRYFELKNKYPDLRQRDASTVHKSQGSTYDTVFIDMANLSTCRNPDLAARLLYVAFTRPRNRVIMYGDLVEKFGGIIV